MQYHHKNGYDHSTHWLKKSVCMPRPVRREQNKGKKIKRFNRSDKFFPTKTAVKSKSVNTSTSAALQLPQLFSYQVVVFRCGPNTLSHRELPQAKCPLVDKLCIVNTHNMVEKCSARVFFNFSTFIYQLL